MDGTYPEIYFCIDQKSFYASVECVERQLDPMTALLVVADAERSKNTICLAVSVGCKKKGIKNRCRLGDIPPNMNVIVAPPRMQLYIDCAAEIHGVFLKYFAPEAIIVAKEMADQLCLDMAARNYLTESISLYIGYSYTQGVPGTGGTATLAFGTNLSSVVLPAVDVLFRRVVRQGYAIRQIGLSCPVYPDTGAYQLNMFEDTEKQLRGKALQEALLGIRSKYGKNAILKGINFDPSATGRERNLQIGGHKSGSEGSKSTYAQK